MATKSSLTNVIVPAHSGNYTAKRKNKVMKITPHHVAGALSAEAIGRIFQASGRNASSNYGIGFDGRIGSYVPEESRAWTSSNAVNDNQAITIEVSNCGGASNWPISDAAWNSLINLCVDICKRYGFRLTYDGTPNGSLTRHNMFSATACPGPTLQSRLSELAKLVNSRLDDTSQKTYTVVKGDSLWKIAQKEMGDGTKWPQIQSLNNLKSTKIYPGQVLKIPNKT